VLCCGDGPRYALWLIWRVIQEVWFGLKAEKLALTIRQVFRMHSEKRIIFVVSLIILSVSIYSTV